MNHNLRPEQIMAGIDKSVSILVWHLYHLISTNAAHL